MAGATAAPRFRTVLLVTFAVVALLLVAIAALAACVVPGRRALRVDPLLALRAE